MKETIYKERYYAHFDKRMHIAQGRAFAENPAFVESYAFYPFLHYTLKQKKYKPESEEKRPIKKREIYYAAHLDRYIYQRYAYELNENYNLYCERYGINQCALAYRTNRKGECNIHFAKEAFDFIKGHHNVAIVIGDFTSFFDNLNHNYLKCCLQKVLGVDRLSNDWFAVYKNICHYSYVEVKDIIKAYKKDNKLEGHIVTRGSLNRNEIIYPFEKIRNEHKKTEGWIHLNHDEAGKKKDYAIPQGTPISGVFANAYMIEFDKMLNDYCNSIGGYYRRYSDDFIVILPNTSSTNIQTRIGKVFEITKTVGERGRLELKEEKTKCYFYHEKHLINISPRGEDLGVKNPVINFLGISFNGTEIDIRDKTKGKNMNKIHRTVRTIYRMHNHIRKDGKIVHISFKPVYRKYGKIYLVKGKKIKSTYLSYLKRVGVVFKGERAFLNLKEKRRSSINRTINRVIHQEEQRALKKMEIKDKNK